MDVKPYHASAGQQPAAGQPCAVWRQLCLACARSCTSPRQDAYTIYVGPVSLDIGCPAGPTQFLAYNGSVPGPTFHVLKGRQSLVRFVNRRFGDC